jgi:hypothetical protein
MHMPPLYTAWINQLFSRLMKVPAFRRIFADQAQKMLAGVFAPERTRPLWRELNERIRYAIVAEAARWGNLFGHNYRKSRTSTWEPQVEFIDSILVNNHNKLKQALVAEGYIPPGNDFLWLKNSVILADHAPFWDVLLI